MERSTATWTDERLDDLSRRVDQGFDRVDADMRSLRSEVTARFDSQQRLLVIVSTGMVGTMVGVIATLVSVFATRG